MGLRLWQLIWMLVETFYMIKRPTALEPQFFSFPWINCQWDFHMRSNNSSQLLRGPSYRQTERGWEATTAEFQFLQNIRTNAISKSMDVSFWESYRIREDRRSELLTISYTHVVLSVILLLMCKNANLITHNNILLLIPFFFSKLIYHSNTLSC